MYLYEHRRCFNNIIGYCNSLCYHGKLQPKRGMEKGTIFPAMGYLQIDGRGMKPNGGSRYNPLEAETIAAWLVAHKDDIERHYGEPLYKVVGVVTPFSAQVNAIKTSLRKLEINGKDEQGSLTVGTVHSLQGRKGRLFSFLLSTQNMKMAGFLIATAVSSMLLSHALKIVFWYLAIWTLSRCSPHFRREGYWQNISFLQIIMRCNLSFRNDRI